jgi:hypothetical protein
VIKVERSRVISEVFSNIYFAPRSSIIFISGQLVFCPGKMFIV